MNKKIIYSFIKTTCGRQKFEYLSTKKDLLSTLRLYWFIIAAAIRDWGLEAQEVPDESNS